MSCVVHAATALGRTSDPWQVGELPTGRDTQAARPSLPFQPPPLQGSEDAAEIKFLYWRAQESSQGFNFKASYL